jgi:hypothetical protein
MAGARSELELAAQLPSSKAGRTSANGLLETWGGTIDEITAPERMLSSVTGPVADRTEQL